MEKILIIEDDTDINNLIAEALLQGGQRKRPHLHRAWTGNFKGVDRKNGRQDIRRDKRQRFSCYGSL